MRKAFGKCECRKSLAEMHPAVVRVAKRLGRASLKTGKHRSLRKIAKELAKIGETLADAVDLVRVALEDGQSNEILSLR